MLRSYIADTSNCRRRAWFNTCGNHNGSCKLTEIRENMRGKYLKLCIKGSASCPSRLCNFTKFDQYLTKRTNLRKKNKREAPCPSRLWKLTNILLYASCKKFTQKMPKCGSWQKLFQSSPCRPPGFRNQHYLPWWWDIHRQGPHLTWKQQVGWGTRLDIHSNVNFTFFINGGNDDSDNHGDNNGN